VWVTGKTKISLRVDETNPTTTDQTAVLIAGTTEVFVAPRLRQARPKGPVPASSPLSAPMDSVHKATNGTAATAAAAISSIKQATSTQTESAGVQHQEPLLAARSASDTPSAKLRVIPPRIARQWSNVIHDIKMCSNAAAAPVGFVSTPTFAKLLTRFAGTKARKGISDDQLWVEILELQKQTIPDAESGAAVMDSTPAEAPVRRGKRVLLLPLRGVADDHVIIGNPLEANAEMLTEGYRNIR